MNPVTHIAMQRIVLKKQTRRSSHLPFSICRSLFRVHVRAKKGFLTHHSPHLGDMHD
jgi:hypothetical protein